MVDKWEGEEGGVLSNPEEGKEDGTEGGTGRGHGKGGWAAGR